MRKRSRLKHIDYAGYYVADFETLAYEGCEHTAVWLWATCDTDCFTCEYGTNIESFMAWCAERQSVVGFHNLAFDGYFILDYLLSHGYAAFPMTDVDELRPGQIKTLISYDDKFYMFEVCFTNGHYCKFVDTLKRIPIPVRLIAPTFNLPEGKGEIDYTKYREVATNVPTHEEIDYIRRDVEIVARAIAIQTAEGMEKMTTASNAMGEYRELLGGEGSKFEQQEKAFRLWFPELPAQMDAVMRHAYKGGFTYVNPAWAGKDCGCGISVDFNSMYPSQMLSRDFPYGMPKYFTGQYEQDDEYPLYIQGAQVIFTLKPDGIPCISLHSGFRKVSDTSYIDAVDEPVTIYATNIDWEIYQEQYDIVILQYIDGFKFKAKQGMFNSYIEKWRAVKESSKGGKRYIAKLFLNSLYGRFGLNPRGDCKVPIYDEVEGRVHLTLTPAPERDTVYLPVAAFCTSWARRALFDGINANKDRFVYCDTDSMHLRGLEDPAGIPLDSKRFCCWKVEGHFRKAVHLHTKCYMWEFAEMGSDDYELKCTCAGAPENLRNKLTWDDFHSGWVNYYTDEQGRFAGWKDGYTKLLPKVIPGGVLLTPAKFSINA